jgi:hypothetical protein
MTKKPQKELGAIIEKVISTKTRMRLLAKLAKGVEATKEVYDKHNNYKSSIIYSTIPDREAIRMLNEMQHGKPDQSLKISPTAGQGGAVGIIFLPARAIDATGRIALPILDIDSQVVDPQRITQGTQSKTRSQEPQPVDMQGDNNTANMQCEEQQQDRADPSSATRSEASQVTAQQDDNQPTSSDT